MTIHLDMAVPTGHQTKQELVYQTLRQAILRCTLRPGQRLVIADIAHRLQVSQIPVREALQQLQSEGLVETVPHSGATVSPISQDALAEVFALLEGLEGATARVAAARLTPAQERTLAGLLGELDEAAAAGDHERWLALDGAFHRAVARFTGMPILQEMTERALDRWERVRRYLFDDSGEGERERGEPLAGAQTEHRSILEAMRARDDVRIEELVTSHHRNALAVHQERLRRLARPASGARTGRPTGARRALQQRPKAHWRRPEPATS